jgi:hypothetical protein
VARDGYAKGDVKRFLWENGRFPVSRISPEWQQRARLTERLQEISGQQEMIPLTARAEDLQVIVAGGPGKHSCWMPTFGGATAPVMRRLEDARGVPLRSLFNP